MYEQVKDIYLVEKNETNSSKGKKTTNNLCRHYRKDDIDPNFLNLYSNYALLLGIQFDEHRFAASGEEDEKKYSS